MNNRPFRRPESHLAEQVTRGRVVEFLQDRGFHVDDDLRVRHGQTIVARTPEGPTFKMRVKLCWRRGDAGRDTDRLTSYSAAQLMARVDNDDWVGSIQAKMEREGSHGVTHLLFVQRDGTEITHAALVPLAAVAQIWAEQRDISDRLIQKGKLGRRKKNHAMNGSSPTLWLQDDRGGQAVVNALWKHPEVADLTKLPVVSNGLVPEEVVNPEDYFEGACRRVAVNAYERDGKARASCLAHHGKACLICGFNFGAVYGPEAEGYIHVHHRRPLSTIAETYAVDPIADLMPICPNCHAVIHLNGGCRSEEEVRRMLTAGRGPGLQIGP